jgi:hypothetical protein
MKKTPLFAFTLGRENKLSLAELIALFGNEALIDFDDIIAIFSLEINENTLIAKFRNI